MRRLLLLVLITLAVPLCVACSDSNGSRTDGGKDAARDYLPIEGPVTKPIHDLPLSPDLGGPDGLVDISTADATDAGAPD
jgi:hypothetical protein